MHYFCRETCGLCRLPAGRPQPTFSWDGEPVQDSSGAASGQAAAAANGTLQAAAGTAGAAHEVRHRQGGRARAFVANEWHAAHAAGGEVTGASEEGVAAQRTVLLVGTLGWSVLLLVSLGAAVRGLWHRRHGRSASELPRRARRPGSSDGAAAAATFPLLR